MQPGTDGGVAPQDVRPLPKNPSQAQDFRLSPIRGRTTETDDVAALVDETRA